MDLLNQTLNSFSGQISDLSVSLNLDIFETNVVNLVILVGGIFYLGSNLYQQVYLNVNRKFWGLFKNQKKDYRRLLQDSLKARNS